MRHATFKMSLKVFVSAGMLLSQTQLWAAQGDEQKALAKSQYMLRQISAEKAELEKKNKDITSQLEAAKAELAKKDALITSTQKLLVATEDRNKQQVDALQSQKQQTLQQEQELKRSNALVAHQKSNIETRLDMQKQNFGLCLQNNHKLYEINRELLGKYENKGFSAILKQKDPFVARQQVEVENLVQEYQYRNEDALVEGSPD
jgi:hypothetical protein